MIAINFQAIQKNVSSVEIMNRWEHEVFMFSESTKNNSLIRVYATSEGLVSKEVRRTGFRIFCYFILFFFPFNKRTIQLVCNLEKNEDFIM